MGRGVSISIISTTMVPTPARRRAIPPTQTDRGSAARHPNHRRSWSCRSGPVASRADAARGPRETGQRVSLANETLSPRCYNRTLASRPVPHAAKQERFNADAGRCTQNTRMGLSPGWSFRAPIAAPLPAPVGLSRGGKSPCTRTGRPVGQQSSSPDASLRQAGQRRSGRQGKQDNGTTDAHRCTPMGRSPACSFGAKPSRPRLVSKAVALVRPHPCASVCICGSIFLLPCRVSHFPACLAACRTPPQALSDRAARQDPMHLRDCTTGAARRLTQRATRRW